MTPGFGRWWVFRILRVVVPERWGDSVEGDLQEEAAHTEAGPAPAAKPVRSSQVLAIAARFGSLRLADVLRRMSRAGHARVGSGGGGRSSGETMFRHLRHGIRIAVREPVTSTVAIVSLGLAVGACAVGFSLIDALMLRPVRGTARPEQLVALYAGSAQRPYGSMSYPDVRDYREASRTLEDIAAFLTADVEVGDLGTAQVVRSEIVTANYFEVVGVRALAGRTFVEAEGRIGAPEVTVISHRFWRQLFGSDREVVGKQIYLAGRPFVVIGVAPEPFRGLTLESRPDLWVTAAHVGALMPDLGAGLLERRHWGIWRGIGRLRPGLSAKQVSAELAGVAAELDRQDGGRFPRVVTALPLQDAAFPPDRYAALRAYATALLMVVGLVLLAACVNVANVLLARGWARRRELAVRMALGADRREICRQLLVESFVVAATGGLGGLLLAAWLMPLIAQVQLPGLLSIDVDLSLDGRLVMFALLVSTTAGLAFGVLPALRLSRVDLVSAVRSGTMAESRYALLGSRRMFLVAQVALSVVLLVGAGLLVRTLLALQAVDPGFDPQSLVAARIDPERTGYPTSSATILLTELQARLAGHPAVARASLASHLPLQPDTSKMNAFLSDGTMRIVGVNLVARDYFATMRIPIVQGRSFTDDEIARGSVIVVNQAMAGELWPGRLPIGEFITTRQGGPRWEIIGVSADAKSASLRGPAEPTMYLPFPRVPKMFSSAVYVLVRMAPDAGGSGLIRGMLQSLSPAVPILQETVLAEAVAASTAPERHSAVALAGFAFLALALGGVFGLASDAVQRRTPELGVRIALGASARSVLALLLREHAALVAAGLVFGLPAAGAASQLLAAQLYGVGALDPWTFAGVAIAISVSGIAATLIPVRRATRIDPVAALRCE